MDVSTLAQTSMWYWHLFNDLSLSPTKMIPSHLLIFVEMFLNLTQQVQMLTCMIQVILHFCPSQLNKRRHSLATVIDSTATYTGTHRGSPTQHGVDISGAPETHRTVDQGGNSLPNHIIQRATQPLWEALVDPTSGRSPFTQKIQEKLILANFHLLSLEPFYSNANPIEHIIVFCVQMLYDTSNIVMCCTFSIILKALEREYYVCLKLLSISSFACLTKKFKFHFLGNVHRRLSATTLLKFKQEEEMLTYFITQFTNEIRGMIDVVGKS